MASRPGRRRGLRSEISRQCGISGLELDRVIEGYENAGVDWESFDWDTICSEIQDFADKRRAIVEKVAELHGVRPRAEDALLVSEVESMIQQFEREVPREEVRKIIEDVVAREGEAIRANLGMLILEELRRIIGTEPLARSEAGLRLIREAIERFDARIKQLEIEARGRAEAQAEEQGKAAEFLIKAELSRLREQVAETARAPKDTLALRVARQRRGVPQRDPLVCPSEPDVELVRERFINFVETDLSTGSPLESIFPLPEDVMVYRCPADGRLFRYSNEKLRETSRESVKSTLQAPAARVPRVGPRPSAEAGRVFGVRVGVPLITPSGQLALDDIISKKAAVVFNMDNAFYQEAQRKGMSLSKMVDEWERTRGPIILSGA